MRARSRPHRFDEPPALGQHQEAEEHHSFEHQALDELLVEGQRHDHYHRGGRHLPPRTRSAHCENERMRRGHQVTTGEEVDEYRGRHPGIYCET